MTQNLGFVETPAPIAKCIAYNLVHAGRDGRVLYPGLGHGRIRDAVARVASHRNVALEEVGVERDPARVAEFEATHPDADVEVYQANFLTDSPSGEFDYVAMNPPYVRHLDIPEAERETYKDRFELASGRFDLFHLFVEQAFDLLAPDGVLVTIVPTTWYSTDSGADFRELVRSHAPHNHLLVPDDAFDAMVSTCILAMDKTPDVEPSFNLATPHPYDVMDLQECCTFDDVYYDRLSAEQKRLQRDADVVTFEEDDDPNQAAIDDVEQEPGHEERPGPTTVATTFSRFGEGR